ncbi:MAG: hypothetical protein EXR07_02760, partial [Acetobacteraceae bacterium]|nr:hypothetical protein [Acetobacteraceae bacterium]
MVRYRLATMVLLLPRFACDEAGAIRIGVQPGNTYEQTEFDRKVEWFASAKRIVPDDRYMQSHYCPEFSERTVPKCLTYNGFSTILGGVGLKLVAVCPTLVRGGLTHERR